MLCCDRLVTYGAIPYTLLLTAVLLLPCGDAFFRLLCKSQPSCLPTGLMYYLTPLEAQHAKANFCVHSPSVPKRPAVLTNLYKHALLSWTSVPDLH